MQRNTYLFKTKMQVSWVHISEIEERNVKQMKPIKTATCNAVYTLEGCAELPVTKYINTNNQEEGVESCWELTEEERLKVLNSGKIYLYIQGATVPPVLLTTDSQIFFNEEDTKQHLCDACEKEYPTCDGHPEFGDGLGNDNVFKCDGYKQEEGAENDNVEQSKEN